MPLILFIAALLIVLLVARSTPVPAGVAAVERALASRWAPLAAGLVTFGTVWAAWGSLHAIPMIQDEAAYVLQARLFASGRWTAPARPLPEFFEQLYVLATPRVASKYPPGHSLLLTPGIWLGLPGLMSVVLSAVTGALVFALARRLANPWVALLSWLVWLTALGTLRWRTAYYSELTTGALWLAAWWALLEWRETGRRNWLLLLAAAVGWCAITRPLTALAFAVPLGAVVIRLVFRRKQWWDLGLAMALGTAVLGVLPLWSARTTGDWRTTPLGLYTRTYMPFDKPGLGFDPTPPLRPIPRDLDAVQAQYRDLHREHSLATLPAAFAARSRHVLRDLYNGWRMALIPFALVGLCLVTAEAVFALVTCATLLLAYLSYAQPDVWSLYYLECGPVFAFVTALGLWRVMTRVLDGARLVRLRAEARSEPATIVPTSPPLDAPRGALATLLLAAAMLPFCTADVVRLHRWRASEQIGFTAFDSLVHIVPSPKAVVFVQYAPNHIVHFSLVTNEPDLDRARAWIVHDRGPAENAKLLRLAPDRAPYLFVEASGTIMSLPGAGLAAAP